MLKGERLRINECPLLLPRSHWDNISTLVVYVHQSLQRSAKGSAISLHREIQEWRRLCQAQLCAVVALPWRDDPLSLKAVKSGADAPTAADPRALPLAKCPAFPTTPLALSPHQGLGTKLVSQAGYAINLNPYQAVQTGGRRKGKTKAYCTALSLGCTAWTWKGHCARRCMQKHRFLNYKLLLCVTL